MSPYDSILGMIIDVFSYGRAALSKASGAIASHPLLYTPYFTVFALLIIGTLFYILRGQAGRAFVLLAALVIATILCSNSGHDLPGHVYRIIMLHRQIDAGNYSLMLTNPLTGETLPTFFYYSTMPYLLPVILSHLGLSALISYKLALSIYLVVLLTGVWKIATTTRSIPERGAGVFYACIFLASNYIVGLWVVRSAFAEIFAYCLVPWIIIALAEDKRDPLKVLLLLTLQIAAHPILVLHCMAINLIGVWAISNATAFEIVRRNALYIGAATILAAPFWAFQFRWRRAILGLDALPTSLSENFQQLLPLFHPLSFYTVGVWIFVAVFLLLLKLSKKLYLTPYINFSSRPGILALAFVASIALQTVYLRDITALLPLMDVTLFPWRLMFVSAFLALLFLWSCSPRFTSSSLKAIAALAAMNMFAICVLASAPFLPQAFVPRPAQEYAYILDYARTNRVWGVAEYFPNYAGIRQSCPDDSGKTDVKASFEHVREGVGLPPSKGGTRVSVEHAPIGFVSYSFSGSSVPPISRCGESLVFGPFHEGGVLRADETTLIRLMIARLLVTAWLAASFGLILGRAVRRAFLAAAPGPHSQQRSAEFDAADVCEAIADPLGGDDGNRINNQQGNH